MTEFKVGDFVNTIIDGKIYNTFKIMSIGEELEYESNEFVTVLYDGEWDYYDDEPSYSLSEYCKPWEPQKGEWCWFWDINSYNEVQNLAPRQFETMFGHMFLAKGAIRGYTNCEPFFGELPTPLSKKEEND